MATKRVRSSPEPAPRSARVPRVDLRQLELPDPVVQVLWRRVHDEAERSDRRVAEDLWDQGTILAELIERTGDEAAVIANFPAGPAAAHERLRIARVTSRWLAGVYGLTRIRLGLALLDRLGVSTLDQLECVDLPVHGPDGKPARFPATPAVLEAALRGAGVNA